ncbi:MAG: AAA family ATPase [Rickettsiales bacterium]|nr:MAG: AAA family ATPase [Rickettsiales bacterium]
MYKYKRYLELLIQQGQSIFLWGARKTGKSTYLKNLYSSSLYIDLLKTDLLVRYMKQPSLLREEILALPDDKLELPIIIDEVQKVPALLDEVHWLIENTNATFVLCGSSARKLKQQGTNLLGGRAIKYHFYPLVYPEYKKDFDLLKIFNHGLIPSHFMSPNPRKLLQAYVEDYLTNEIRSEGYVRNIPAFSRFLDSTIFSDGEMLNYNNIARDVGIDAKTVKEYYQILVDTLVGYLIYPYKKKMNRDIISHTPKFYYFDVGVATRIGKKHFENLAGAEAGRALEHFILMELMAFLNLTDSDHKLYYWRTRTKLEVDFILSDNVSKPIPIEIKISKLVHKTEFKPMKAFMKEHEVNRGYVVCLEETSRKIKLDEDKEIIILPVEQFLANLWEKKLI